MVSNTFYPVRTNLHLKATRIRTSYIQDIIISGSNDVRRKNHQNKTPLYYIAKQTIKKALCKTKNCISIFLKAERDINTKDNKCTPPLHYTVEIAPLKSHYAQASLTTDERHTLRLRMLECLLNVIKFTYPIL